MMMVEIAGPPTMAMWLLSWEVFSTACIMLDIIDLGTLLAYRTHMMTLHSRYGPQAWLLLYQADSRFRSEHLIRTKRLLADAHARARDAGGTTAFTVDRPWSFSMSTGLNDATWWQHEFTEPAMMLMARTASLESVVSFDAPVRASGGAHTIAPPISHQVMEYGAGVPKKRKDSDLSRITNGEYTANRSGNALCAAFQTGACGQFVGNHMCPTDRTKKHQCSICLDSSHGKASCTKTAKEPHTKVRKVGGKGGKGKGKGKGDKNRW